MKKKILLTGGSGFIGYEFLKKLILLKNYDIFCIVNKRKINLKNIKCFKVNLLNLVKLKKIINKINPDIVFHFAGYVNPAKNQIYKDKSKKLNFLATKNLCQNIKSDCHIIFSSTDKVYKNIKTTFRENNLVSSKFEYAKNKIKSEKLIIKKFKKHHIFRIPIIHGKGNLKSSSIIDKSILKIKNYQKNYLYKNLYRSFLYQDDFNKCLIKCLKNTQYGVYNVGTKKMSYFNRAKQILKKMNINFKDNLKADFNLSFKNPEIVLNSEKAKKVFKQKFH